MMTMRRMITRHGRRFWTFAFDYLSTVAKRERQLALLALVGLAPGVAALTAWLHVAYTISQTGSSRLFQSWLLPNFLLMLIGVRGVLVGAGVVTMLIGCLGLTNVYLISLERRAEELALLNALGFTRSGITHLLLLEVLCMGLLGSGAGVLLGAILSYLSWPAASSYFGLDIAYSVQPIVLLLGGGIGLLATLLFMGSAVQTMQIVPATILRGRPLLLFDQWHELRMSFAGAFFAALLALLASLFVLPLGAVLWLAAFGFFCAFLLIGSGWALTNLYRHLPTSGARPLWTMAVQSLERHRNYTACMVLSLTAGAYGVGISALTWLSGAVGVGFPMWVAGMILVAGASLVFTIAAISAWERRHEFAMLMALGARPSRVRHLILIEYAIVAFGGGIAGALFALINWIWAGAPGRLAPVLLLLFIDVAAAFVSAWVGALPVLWVVARLPFRKARL